MERNSIDAFFYVSFVPLLKLAREFRAKEEMHE